MSPAARAVLIALALLPAVAGARPRPAPCPDGAYLLGGDDPHASVVIRRGAVTLTPDCPAIAARIRATASRTHIRARWTSCPGLPGPITLRTAIAAPACTAMTGSLRVRDAAPRVRRLAATRAPYTYDVPLDPTSPWPKFRRTAAQDGAEPRAPVGHRRRAVDVPHRQGDLQLAGRSAPTAPSTSARPIAPSTPSRADGTVRWKHLTGEIIDSSALLDDRGRVYFGSGDGKLYALDAATGAPVWTFAADPPSANRRVHQLVRGQRRHGPATARSTSQRQLLHLRHRSRHRAPSAGASAPLDQTWSLPAFDVDREPALHRQQQPAAAARQRTPSRSSAASGLAVWQTATDGTDRREPAASPTTARWSSAASTATCAPTTRRRAPLAGTFGDARPRLREPRARCPTARSCSRRPTAPSTRSTRRPARCAGRSTPASRSARRPRSTPTATSTSARARAASSCSNPDGTLRWSMRLIDDDRNDLNASPALGTRRDRDRRRERRGLQRPVRLLPARPSRRERHALHARHRARTCRPTGAALFFTTQLRAPLASAAGDDRRQPAAHVLALRAPGRRHACWHIIDSSALRSRPIRRPTSASRCRATASSSPSCPRGRWLPPAGGTIAVTDHAART